MILCESSLKSEKGLQSSFNQDYVLEFSCSQGHLWLVADGEGENLRGVQASRLMADTIRSFIEDNKMPNSQDLLRKAIIKANEILHKKMLFAEGAMAFHQGNQVFIATFGKNKALLWAGKNLQEIQSTNPQLGQQAVIQPNITALPLQKNAQILLLSKGAFLGLNFDLIKNTLQSRQNIQEKVESLIKASLQSQNNENSSIALIYFPQESFLKVVQRIWKPIQPFVVPVLFLATIATFVIVTQKSHRQEVEKIENEQIQFQKAREKKRRLEDSLAQVDKAKDVIIKHKVQKGETIGTIARKYNSTVEALISLNILDDKANVAVGQEVKVNVKMIYTLPKAQTLESLYNERFKRWEKLGVTIESIQKANKPKELKGLLPQGTQIIIPALNKK